MAEGGEGPKPREPESVRRPVPKDTQEAFERLGRAVRIKGSIFTQTGWRPYSEKSSSGETTSQIEPGAEEPGEPQQGEAPIAPPTTEQKPKP